MEAIGGDPVIVSSPQEYLDAINYWNCDLKKVKSNECEAIIAQKQKDQADLSIMDPTKEHVKPTPKKPVPYKKVEPSNKPEISNKSVPSRKPAQSNKPITSIKATIKKKKPKILKKSLMRIRLLHSIYINLFHQ